MEIWNIKILLHWKFDNAFSYNNLFPSKYILCMYLDGMALKNLQCNSVRLKIIILQLQLQITDITFLGFLFQIENFY